MLQVPRLIRWIGSLALFFLVVMTLLRVGTFFTLDRANLPASQLGPAFWLGFRFDARVIASALLPLLVLGSLSFLDPFKSKLARRLWLVLLVAFWAGLLVFYVADFLHYHYLNQRLNASVLARIARA